MNLLHLVSEQNAQNLLPLLAFRPKNVIQVRSSGEHYEKMAARLQGAVEELARSGRWLFPSPNFIDWPIPCETPTVGQSCRSVAEALSRWPECVVNLTGGTKQMSIGAYHAAEDQRRPALYCDSQAGEFRSLSKKNPLPASPSFKEAAHFLTVKSLLTLHGIDPQQLRSTNPTDAEIQFAHAVYDIHQCHENELRALLQSIRAQLYPDGRRPATVGQIEGILRDGLPQGDTPVACNFYSAAQEAGYLLMENGHFFYRMEERNIGNRARLQRALKLSKALVGGWYEVLVYDHMREGGRFHDLQTEIQSRNAEQALGETDIVGVNLQKPGLIFVSCKLSGDALQKPLEHVFATRQRATEFGGTFAEAVLCVLVIREQQKRDLETACRVARVRLVTNLEEFA